MQAKVKVGVSTVAGYTVTVAGFAGGVYAYWKGDRSEQTLGVVSAGLMAAFAFGVTQVGRYVQAHALAKRSAPAPGVLSSALQRYAYSAGLGDANVTAGSLATPATFGSRTGEDDEPLDIDPDHDPEYADYARLTQAPAKSFIADPKDKRSHP